jgi:hypothetical protein
VLVNKNFNGGNKTMIRKEVAESILKGGDPDEHIAISEWSFKDVLIEAEEDEIALTKEEAEKIIDEIHTECAGGPIDRDTLSDAIKGFNDSLPRDCFTCTATEIYKPVKEGARGTIAFCGDKLCNSDDALECNEYKRDLSKINGEPFPEKD